MDETKVAPGGTETPATKTAVKTSDAAKHANKTSAAGNIEGSGLNSKILVEDYRNFIKAPCEDVWSNADSYIVLGRDRPSGTLASDMGYGGKGVHGAHMIDLVVGRHATYRGLNPDRALAIAEYDDKGNVVRNIGADPDFTNDAARIYISQKCDIDDYFELDSPPAVGHKARGFSGIGLMADEVRVVARHGVRLVTASGNVNSQGALNAKKGYGTALVHGNSTEGPYKLQPMVLGNNLEDLLKKMIDIIDSNNGLIANIHQALISYLLPALSNHTHEAPGSPSALASAMATVATIIESGELANKIPAAKTNYALLDASCLTAFGAGYILSDWHLLN